MKKRFLLIVAMIALLVCVFAISASAAYDKSEVFKATDGTDLALYDADGNALAWFYDSSASKYVSYRVGIDFTMALNSGRELLPTTAISGTDGTAFPYTVSNMILLNGRDYAAFTYISGRWKDLPIQAIYVNNNFQWINKNSFDSNTTLRVFDIPADQQASKLHIGSSAFWKTTALEEFFIPKNAAFEGNATFEWSGVVNVVFADDFAGTTLPDFTFYKCYSLESVTLPNSIKTIGQKAFAFDSAKNDNIVSFKITIPANVEAFGNYVFQNNTSLVEIKFAGTKLATIGTASFENCQRLPSIVLPEGLVTLGNCAFKGAKGLTSVTFPTTLTTLVDKEHFLNTGLTEVIGLENTQLTRISYSMFKGLKNWKPDVLKLPNTLETIETYGLADVGMKSIVLGAKLVSINNEALTGCSSLQTVYLPATLTTINFNNSTGKLFFVTSEDATYLETIKSKSGASAIVSYADYSANPTDYASGKYVISGYNACEAFYNGEHKLDPEKSNACAGVCANCGEKKLATNPVHDYVTTIVYTNYLAKGTKTQTCQNPGCAHNTTPNVTSVDPIVSSFKGFSTKEVGDGLTFGYTLNLEAIKEYEAVNSTTLEFGFVVAVQALLGENAPLDKDGNAASNNVIKASITSEDHTYTGADFRLTSTSWDGTANINGVETALKDIKFYMAGYILDGASVVYINSGATGDKADALSYKDVAGTEIIPEETPAE